MSPRRADPELADRRREALVKAGYGEILEKGIQGLTIDSVVARAKSSKGGALYYFATKEDLLYGILKWLLAQVSQSLDEVVQSEDTPRARLAAELEVLFHSTEVNRKLYLVYYDYVSLGARKSRFRELLADFLAECRQRDTRLIEEGIRVRQFRRVAAAEAASTIRALVDGYCLQWLMAPEDTPIENYRNLCRAVLGAYLLH